MSEHKGGFFNNVEYLLRQDYRGVNIVVYAVATAGLAVAVYRIRPVSKFSVASKVPDHFIKKHETLKGVYAGVQNSPARVLIDHQAPIYLPLWHSSKPPLKVKLWGVDIASGNAMSWLECVAKNRPVTFRPIGREKEDLVSVVLLHLPQEKIKKVESLDIGHKLVELGFAKVDVPSQLKKNSLESKLAPVLLSAEAKAKKYRNGVWADTLPPLPAYVVYWRKGSKVSKEVAYEAARTLLYGLAYASKSALVGTKNLLLRPFRSKRVQAT